MGARQELNDMADEAHENAKRKGFWDDTPEGSRPNLAEKIGLIHCEVSELMEAHRDDPLKLCGKHFRGGRCLQLTMEEEELADIILRVLDFAAYRGVNIERAVELKHAFNLTRPVKHGKRF